LKLWFFVRKCSEKWVAPSDLSEADHSPKCPYPVAQRMNLIRTIARSIATGLWFLFGGMLGATITFMGITSISSYLSDRGQPLNAGGAMGAAADVGLGLFCAPVGFGAGLAAAVYFWERWSLFHGKPE
jgi:hypothetical protein